MEDVLDLLLLMSQTAKPVKEQVPRLLPNQAAASVAVCFSVQTT
jgi:hypothetical protein